MPFGSNDWLALTTEPTLEPELPICDPHHHFWDFRTARIPYQRYLLHELADDINSGHNVRSTVFIEARAMLASLSHRLRHCRSSCTRARASPVHYLYTIFFFYSLFIDIYSVISPPFGWRRTFSAPGLTERRR